MGYIRHHAIVVSSWNEADLKEAHKKATELFGETVSNIVPAHINSDTSFFIGPDGSKEGWEDSDAGDQNRKLFTDYLESRADEDGGNSLKYAELFYGDDDGESEIERHN